MNERSIKPEKYSSLMKDKNKEEV